MKHIVIVFSTLMIVGCQSGQGEIDNSSFPELTGKYFGQNEPGMSPELFAPNIISTGMAELNACFSPDYQEFFYSIILPEGQYVLMTMSYSDNKWSAPEVANFSGNYSDADPFITVDGKWLYFVSKRPKDTTQQMKEDWDIWRVEKVNGVWSNPEKLGGDINSETNDIYPSLTRNGTLYYSSGKDGGNDNNDLYYAISNGTDFEPSIRMNDSINTHWEGDVFISPDEDYMIYGSYGREENGLYISFNNDGKWIPPVRMNEDINQTGWEFCPIISPDGKFFFFTSNRAIEREESKDELTFEQIKRNFEASYTNPGNGNNDVYWVDAEIINSYRN